MAQQAHIEFVFEPKDWAARMIAGLEELDRLTRKACAGEVPSK